MNTLQPALDQYFRDGNQAALIEAIESLRPAPKLVEGWVNVYPEGRTGSIRKTVEQAKVNASKDCIRQAFVREVTPPDESKRWRNQGKTVMQGEKRIAVTEDYLNAQRLVAAHNEAMGFGKEAE